jgi:hypothetical protein
MVGLGMGRIDKALAPAISVRYAQRKAGNKRE